MKKSDINPMPPYFDHYINLVADVELPQAFAESIHQLNEINKDLLQSLESRSYAPNKWTVKGILQHIIDWERILSYRALLFARNEGSVPQGIDEKLLAANMNAEERSIDELIDELKVVRAATKSMFGSFNDEVLQNKGTNWKYEISVLAVGFTMIGHQIHHLKTVEERYVPLLEARQTNS